MSFDTSHKQVRDLIRLQGLPPAPASSRLLTEVRTDGVVPLSPPNMLAPAFSMGKLLVEWRYRVPTVEVDRFTNFLKTNESFIAACCRKLMKGVDYRGTYRMPVDEAFLYKSLWAYDSPVAVEQWSELMKSDSQFVAIMKRLRAYWVSDARRIENRYEQVS